MALLVKFKYFIPGLNGEGGEEMTRVVGCHVSQISRVWPPPLLPGGFTVGDAVTFVGAAKHFNDGPSAGDRKV